MRAAFLFGFAAIVPAVLAQDDVEKNSANNEEVPGGTDEAVVKIPTDSLDSSVDLAADTSNASDGDGDNTPELAGAEVKLEFSYTRKYDVSKEGHLIMPRNGRRYELFPDMYLKRLTVDKGPCTINYQNKSEISPPPPEGYEDFEETQEKTIGPEGGEIKWQEVNFKKTMNYIYCGNQDEGEKPADEDDKGEEMSCENVIKGGSAVDKGQVCCLPPTEWQDGLWDLLEMDTYLKDAVDHFNKNGWDSNVMNTFSTYDLSAYRKVTELGKDDQGRDRPRWEWNCGGINSNQCTSKDLSDWNACRADPKRRLLLQAMENFSGMWQSAQSQFTQDALSKIIMTLPNITKDLFPLEGKKPDFNAPGDYQDSSWILIASSIAGVLGLPFAYMDPEKIKSNPNIPNNTPKHGPVGVAVVGAILSLVGLAMGPTLNKPFEEEDPHFTKFGDFSEEVGKKVVENIYKGYSSVYNTYFHTPSGQEPPQTIDGEGLGNLMSEGKLIRPWRTPSDDINNGLQTDMTNRFLQPMVNLAFQRNQVFLIKVPKGGIEFWQHNKQDKTNTRRSSVIWDPCGDHQGNTWGYHPNFVTSNHKDQSKAIWHPYGATNRGVCNDDGSGTVFFSWSDNTEKAFADFGWTAMDERGLKMSDIVEESLLSQDSNGWFGRPTSFEDRIGDMSEAAGAAMHDPTAWDFWNLAYCDLTNYHDENTNLIRVEECDKYDLEPAATGGAVIGPSCINFGIRDRCSKNMKDKNGNEFPFKKD